jgi:hypothetical protein
MNSTLRRIRQGLACWRVGRSIVRRLDDGRALEAWMLAHAEQCPACRPHYQQAQAMIQGLTATAAGARRAAPPFLRARIMAELRGERRRASATGWSALRAWQVAVVTLALAGLVLGLVLRRSRPGPGADNENPDWRDAVALLSQWAGGNDMVAWGNKVDEPLETELRLVVSDARNALGSLSRSFLPEEIARRWSPANTATAP